MTARRDPEDRTADRTLDERALAVRIFRALKDWRQEELSRASGVDRSLISRYEKGRKRPSLPMLARLAAGADFPVARLEELLLVLRAVGSPKSGWRTPPGEPAPPVAPSAQAIAEAVAEALLPALGEATLGLARFRAADLPQAADRSGAPRRLARLLGFQPHDRRRLVELADEHRSWAVVELAGEASARAAADDAAEALELAHFALFVAERVPGGDAWRARVQGYAWAFVGNARRVGSDLDGAEAAFARARELWAAGSAGDPGLLDPSRPLDLEASLLRARRRFGESRDLLGRALAAAPSPERAGSILLKTAFTHEQAGDCEAAAAALARAAPLLAGGSERRLVWVHRLNLAVNLCHLGRHAEAAPLAAEARELAVVLENEIDLLRVLWLDSRIAAGLGRREEAVAALRRVRRDFAGKGIAYDAALATLDLAVLLLDENANAEVRALAEEMVAIFASLEVHREALAAARVFWRAVEQEAATAELGRRLLRYLERARHDPGLRFEPGPP